MRAETVGSRREFLTGRLGPGSYQIASLVVQAWPGKLSEIQRRLDELEGVETHATDPKGRLIVTVEAEIVETINRIEAIDGVITAMLVYHQIEEGDDER